MVIEGIGNVREDKAETVMLGFAVIGAGWFKEMAGTGKLREALEKVSVWEKEAAVEDIEVKNYIQGLAELRMNAGGKDDGV